MIFSILFSIFGSIIGGIASILEAIPFPSWPQGFIDGIEYFGEKILLLNFIFPAYEFLILTTWMIGLLASYYFMALLGNLFNWIRGSGGIKI